MNALFLPIAVPVLATTVWYLAAAAEITEAFWSRYPRSVDNWARCPACSGTWWGLGWALPLIYFGDWSFFGLRGAAGCVLAALWCTFWVPILARRMYEDLTALHPPKHVTKFRLESEPETSGDVGR